MKKSLLATTALAAMGAVAVASPASAKFEVGVSGYMEQWFGYADNNDNQRASNDAFDQISDSEFFIGFSQTLDNGLKIGGEIQVEGQQDASAEHVDEQYIYVSGSFGRIELGTDNGAAYRMHYGIASQGVGLDESDITNWIGGTAGDLRRTATVTGIDNDENKITYFSPRINGFQVGASYMPERDVNNATVNQATPEADGARDNGFSVAANYKNSFNELSLAASIGYEDGGEDDAVAGDESALSLGLRVGFGGFTASVAYGEHQRDDGTATDVNNFGVGLAYANGPMGVSMGYIRGEDSDSNEEQDSYEVGVSYKMGPGVKAVGSVYYGRHQTNNINDGEGAAIVGGLRLNF
jgi:predicted porin